MRLPVSSLTDSRGMTTNGTSSAFADLSFEPLSNLSDVWVWSFGWPRLDAGDPSTSTAALARKTSVVPDEPVKTLMNPTLFLSVEQRLPDGRGMSANVSCASQVSNSSL